jgi:hypothetical protein
MFLGDHSAAAVSPPATRAAAVAFSASDSSLGVIQPDSLCGGPGGRGSGDAGDCGRQSFPEGVKANGCQRA